MMFRSILFTVVLFGAAPTDAAVSAVTPADLIEKTGLRAGLILIVGDPEPGLADRLAGSGRWLVHRLVPAQEIEAARVAALKAGIHGRIVLDATAADGRLPHPDRFVDVVVASLEEKQVDEQELYRVLNVGGTAVLRRGAAWQSTVRPPEKGIDDWSHKWHGPSGGVLSRDEKAGPPTAIQWTAGPALADGAMSGKHPVIGSGAFAAVDNVDGAVQVRSSGNGLPRWRRSFALPPAAELVIDRDRLLCRPPESGNAPRSYDESGRLTGFQLATGDKAIEYSDAPQPSAAPGKRGSFPEAVALPDKLVVTANEELAVLDRGTGKRIWGRRLDGAHWFSPIVSDGVLIAAENDQNYPTRRARIDNAPGARAIVAHALADGAPLWRFEPVLKQDVSRDPQGNPQRAALLPLIAAEGMVFLHTSSYQCRQPGAFIAALDLQKGTQLWRFDLPEGDKIQGAESMWSSTDSASRLICRDGTLYYLGGHSRGGVAAFDARTGRITQPFRRRPPGYSHGGGGECSGSTGTVNWLVTSTTTWWDRELKWKLCAAARSACGTGIFPAQGMVFANPAGCDCANYARGYLGLRSAPLPPPVEDSKRLLRGPADAPPVPPEDPAAWPTFLAAADRGSAVKHGLPVRLAEKWRARPAPPLIDGPLADDRRRDEYWNGSITAPVAAHGTVVVGLADGHALAAIDARSGKIAWQTPLGGPMDAPPTLHAGLCLQGTQDGWISALRLDDGKMVWRFLAAPAVVPAMLNGRLASAFPVPGAVLIMGDHLLATAGYHSYLGGIHAYALDPRTGEVRGRSSLIGGPNPRESAMVLGDVLCLGANGDDAWIFRSYRLGKDAELLPLPQRVSGKPAPAGWANVRIDRRAGFVRYPHDRRGGSTHGWNHPMSSGGSQGFRVANDGQTVFVMQDPTGRENAFRTGPHVSKAAVLSARRGDADRSDPPLWQRASSDLGFRESLTALVKAGDRLYLGGGKRDGSEGFVLVLGASDGSILQELPLPAQVVACGLAAAGGQLIASCVDGTVVAFGAP